MARKKTPEQSAPSAGTQALELARQTSALEAENEQLRMELADSLANSPHVALVSDPKNLSTRAKIVQALGIDMPAGVEVSDEVILDVITRLIGPTSGGEEGVMVKKNETLADAVAANKGERAELSERLTSATTLVNRIGAIMGVDKWSPDGAELVEKVQRFSTFHYWLKKRVQELESSTANSDAAVELRRVITVLVGEAKLAQLLQSKPVAATKTVLDLAEHPTEPEMRFVATDLAIIETALRDDRPRPPEWPRNENLAGVFLGLQSAAVGRDLVDFMNTVVLPALARLKATTQPKGN